MQRSNQGSKTTQRTRAALIGLRRAGIFAAVVGLIAVVGCPPTPPRGNQNRNRNVNNANRPPNANNVNAECTTNADCDDALFCNGAETCVAGVCQDGTAPCAAGETCNETTDMCEPAPCTTDAMCDDGAFCNGAETCVAGACVDGVSPCAAGETCNETTDMCEPPPPPCTTDADCVDDGLFCNGDEVCTAGVCTSEGNPCAAGETCNETTDTCEPPCTTDADCDDMLFCNGAETCVAGVCQAGTAPCAAGETCDEATDTCLTPCAPRDLTTDTDTITGCTGNDVITATVGTLNAADIVVGNGGNDVMNATIAGASSGNPSLIDIDTLNITTLNNATLDLENSAAIGTITVTGTGNLTLDDVETDTVLSMGAGYSRVLAADLATNTATDEVSLVVNGTGDGAAANLTAAAGVIETLNVDVTADSTLAAQATGPFGMVDDAIITGDGDLTLTDITPAILGFTDIDATGQTGELIIATEMGTFDFSDGAAQEALGIDRVILTSTGGGNADLTFDVTDGPITTDISGVEAGMSFGTLALAFDGSNTDDTVTLNLGGEGDGTGVITATDVDELNINSGGTTANEIASGSSIGTSAFPLPPKTLNISGDQDLDLGTFTADIIDATGFTGNLTVTGGATANVITGGDGDDSINGAGGADVQTGGDGADSFVLDQIGGPDSINDFTAGASGDMLIFDVSALMLAGSTEFVGAIGSLPVDSSAEIVVLTGAGYASVDAAETAVAGQVTTDGFPVVVVFFNTTSSRTNVLYDADAGVDDADGSAVQIAVLDNITTQAGNDAITADNVGNQP